MQSMPVNHRRATRRASALTVVVASLALAGCGPSAAGSAGTLGSGTSALAAVGVNAKAAPAASTPAAATRSGSALAALIKLPVKGRAPMTGYSRARFGPAWTDVNHVGCDTRNQVLRRDLQGDVFKPGTHNCVVLSGHFTEPYSGRLVTFHRGVGTSTAIQIDHVVALADAWQTGAQSWTPKKRLQYANDLLVLLAADGPLNEKKGASDAASWLPPNKSFRCAYVARQVAIKAKYGLWVTPAEKGAIGKVLNTCPVQQLPSR